MRAAPCALGDPSCFIHVNASGLSLHAALQVLVLQGLASREFGPAVWVSGVERYPGAVGIEWFPGDASNQWGSWHPQQLVAGLRKRWLETVVRDTGRSAVLTNPSALLTQARPLLRGGILYAPSETHALGVVLTMCGLDDLLPVLSPAELPAGLPVAFDARGRFADAAAAASYTARHLLPRCNDSTLAVQAGTNAPFLADVIVSWRLATFWMDDMCANTTQRAILDYILEGSGHFSASATVQYLGWFNHTRQPNPELLEECTAQHRLITIASDWAENLAFLSSLPIASRLSQPPDRVTARAPDRMPDRVADRVTARIPDRMPDRMPDRVADRVTDGAADLTARRAVASSAGARAAASASAARPADGPAMEYDASLVYAAVIMSDGDNLAEDWSTLRPVLERRIRLKSTTPISWTLSNRWATMGPPVLRWFYEAAARANGGGYDSYLMGPSGYGYLFPGNVSRAADRAEFAQRTIEAAKLLDMQAYVHWDVDQSMDPEHAAAHAEAALALYNGSAIRGAFLLGSVGLRAAAVGDVTVIGSPIVPWGFSDPVATAALLGRAPRGTLTYVYQTLGTDPKLVDELATQLPSHVRLVGHRTLLQIARARDARANA